MIDLSRSYEKIYLAFKCYLWYLHCFQVVSHLLPMCFIGNTKSNSSANATKSPTRLQKRKSSWHELHTHCQSSRSWQFWTASQITFWKWENVLVLEVIHIVFPMCLIGNMKSNGSPNLFRTELILWTAPIGIPYSFTHHTHFSAPLTDWCCYIIYLLLKVNDEPILV